MSHTLEVDSIHFELGSKKILSNIFLSCKTNQIVGLLGKNGVGKSTLMKIIFGAIQCDQSVRIDRVFIKNAFKRHTLISYLPQHNFIPKSLSIKNIFADFEIDLNEFLQFFPEFMNREKLTMNRFSGGERRIIEIYTLVKSRSKFSLLDEPFTLLSPLQIENVKLLLSQTKSNKGLIITDHLHQHILDISDYTYILRNGQTYLCKETSEIASLGYVRI